MSEIVAVFGGSFNPPHVGHVMAAVYTLSVCQVDRFLVVPCFIHPFSKSLAPFDDRLAMCRIAFEWIARVQVSDVERRLGGESKTLRTVQHLHQEHPDWQLRLVVGSDVVPEVPRWYGFDQIQKIAPPMVLGRPGWESQVDTPMVFPDISSSRIRSEINGGRLDRIRPWLPCAVADYIRDHTLYLGGA